MCVCAGAVHHTWSMMAYAICFIAFLWNSFKDYGLHILKAAMRWSKDLWWFRHHGSLWDENLPHSLLKFRERSVEHKFCVYRIHCFGYSSQYQAFLIFDALYKHMGGICKVPRLSRNCPTESVLHLQLWEWRASGNHFENLVQLQMYASRTEQKWMVLFN